MKSKKPKVKENSTLRASAGRSAGKNERDRTISFSPKNRGGSRTRDTSKKKGLSPPGVDDTLPSIPTACPSCSTPLTPETSGNLEQTAARFDISPQGFRQWIAKGAPSIQKASPGNPWLFCFSCVEIHRAGLAEEKEDAKKTKPDYWSEKTRREKAEATLAEMKLAQLRGDLVEQSAVTRAWQNILQSIRDNLLAMPAKVAPLLATTTTPAEALQILQEEIHAILENLSAPEEHPPDGGDSPRRPGASKADDRQPVGRRKKDPPKNRRRAGKVAD